MARIKATYLVLDEELAGPHFSQCLFFSEQERLDWEKANPKARLEAKEDLDQRFIDKAHAERWLWCIANPIDAERIFMELAHEDNPAAAITEAVSKRLRRT